MALFPDIYPADPLAPEHIHATQRTLKYGVLGSALIGLASGKLANGQGKKKRWNAPGHWFERGRNAVQSKMRSLTGRGLAAG